MIISTQRSTHQRNSISLLHQSRMTLRKCISRNPSPANRNQVDLVFNRQPKHKGSPTVLYRRLTINISNLTNVIRDLLRHIPNQGTSKRIQRRRTPHNKLNNKLGHSRRLRNIASLRSNLLRRPIHGTNTGIFLQIQRARIPQLRQVPGNIITTTGPLRLPPVNFRRLSRVNTTRNK